jgi:hypothetical protein
VQGHEKLSETMQNLNQYHPFGAIIIRARQPEAVSEGVRKIKGFKSSVQTIKSCKAWLPVSLFSVDSMCG